MSRSLLAFLVLFVTTAFALVVRNRALTLALHGLAFVAIMLHGWASLRERKEKEFWSDQDQLRLLLNGLFVVLVVVVAACAPLGLIVFLVLYLKFV